MLNFTLGPVMAFDGTLSIGARDVPYFRTPDFSQIMLRNERLMNELVNAPEGSRTVFITGSGTAAMEASVMGVLDGDDRALVIDGGTFGRRLAELCDLHGIPCTSIRLVPGEPLTQEDLDPFEGGDYTALLVNVHESSSGVLYDGKLISEFCRRNSLLLVVDAISSFLADPFDMTDMGAHVVIVGSQKALACAPGISAVTLAPTALARVERSRTRCMYLDLKLLLENGRRGQTPFTPAVGILLQVEQRLRDVASRGVESEIARVGTVARDFRSRMAGSGLPVSMRLSAPSNAATYLETEGFSARQLAQTLKDDYGIWICPNGGERAEDSFRVGHIGNLTVEDNETLLAALCDMEQRGMLGRGGL